jgi:hypothetical protein
MGFLREDNRCNVQGQCKEGIKVVLFQDRCNLV